MKKGFPSEYLHKDMTVLSLFCAAFQGRNDISFLKQAGIKDVVMVDKDATKLSVMVWMFPYRADCYDILKALEDDVNFGKYDLVICDQWSNHDELINDKYLPKLKKISKKYLFLSCCETFLKGERPEGEYFLRNDYLGGIYWRVIKL